jgi:hypothetical protein
VFIIQPTQPKGTKSGADNHFLGIILALTIEMVKIISIGPLPHIAGVLMVNDDVLDKFYETEIGAADQRIQHLVGTVKTLEKAGRHQEANKNREILALITQAQEFRRIRHQRVQAFRYLGEKR